MTNEAVLNAAVYTRIGDSWIHSGNNKGKRAHMYQCSFLKIVPVEPSRGAKPRGCPRLHRDYDFSCFQVPHGYEKKHWEFQCFCTPGGT